MPDAAIVPIRGFRGAKQRLAPCLDTTRREALARDLAIGVLDALSGTPTFVVTGDDEVAGMARDRAAVVVEDRAGSLDGAVQAAVATARAAGFDRLLVTHADLPFPASLATICASYEPGELVLVPDRRLDGTNVILLPDGVRFGFAYGPGSFRRHLAEGHRTGCPVVVVEDSPLSWDIDLPDDLTTPPEWGPGPTLARRL